MEYKQQKDNMVMENARLQLLNQGAVVAAMSALAEAIQGTRGSTAPTTEEHTSAGHDSTAEEHSGSAHQMRAAD
jgi:hypothetical protein